jgi:SPX domain protein involved in polyphosphate accumulation
MIFKRHEIKYLITKEQQLLIKQAFEKHMIADEHGESTICSLYFDTPSFQLIRRSIEHPVYKEKLRLRSYGVASSDTKVFIELKKKYKKVVVAEQNMGQFAGYLRMKIDGFCPMQFNQVKGQPFVVEELIEAFTKMMEA